MEDNDKKVKEFLKDMLERLKTDEGMECRPLSDYISTTEILLDLKVLMDGIFEAELFDLGDALELDFPNGQKFRIGVEEVFGN